MRHERDTPRPAASGPRIETWDGPRFADHLAEAMHIYSAAMQYPEHTGTQRGASARKHTGNAGFACRAAVLDDGTLVGFGYGYTTAPGQWWHDLVQRALTREAAAEWLHDSFELSELHVLPDHHGGGIGRELLTSLAGGITQARMMLSLRRIKAP